ncbi:MAG: hypothetical protein LUD19_01060 [Clostridia bacterium]|nr:hypothetical protein [Clostridia bacterium]
MFTTAPVMCYNFIVKKLAVLLTTALAAFSFTAGTAVYAEDGQSGSSPSYPDLASVLAFDSLDAYGVNEDQSRFAFAQGNYIYVYDGTKVSDYYYSGTLENDGSAMYCYEHGSAVTGIEFDGNSIVFTDGTATYSLADGKAVEYSYAFASLSTVDLGGGLLISMSGGAMYVYQSGSSVTFNDQTYSCLKVCSGTIYVLRGSELCVVEGSSLESIAVTPLTFEYVDLSQGETILTGDTAQYLSAVSQEVKTVTLAAGTYVTQADISDLSGTYFKTGESGTFALSADTKMLYLCTTGGVDVLALGSDIYLTKSGNTPAAAEQEAYTSSYAYMNTATNVYSRAYMADATVIGSLEFDDIVQVNGLYSDDTLQCGFAYVSYTADDGMVIEGYVASNFITEYYFTAEDGEFGEAEYSDDYSEDDVIVAVCIVIIIVVLVIAGVGYIGYSSGAGKRKKKNDDEQK